MLKAAIEKITELTGAKTYHIGDRVFTDVELTEVRPGIDAPSTYPLTSLAAMVAMIRGEAMDLYAAPYFITIPSCHQVECFTRVEANKRFSRNILYRATATDVPGWQSETKLPFEKASIALQTRFQDTPDRNYVLRVLSQITCGAKVTYNDSGVATTVVTQKGVALQGSETIKPIVRLKPYRTFQEVEQPASLFLIRVDEHGISFVEADGGMWKLEARKTIKAYFEKEMEDMIKDGLVVLML